MRFTFAQSTNAIVMTEATKQTFRSGWGIAIAVLAIVSIVADLWSPSVTSPTGQNIQILGAGSAILGFLAVVVCFVVPALIYRELVKRHLPKWAAVIWCLVAWCTWILVTEPPPGTAPPRPRGSLLAAGCLIVCWRLLRHGADIQQVKTFYFRRGSTGRIEGPGPLLHIRAHLMKHGGLAGVEYTQDIGVPPAQIAPSDWRPLA